MGERRDDSVFCFWLFLRYFEKGGDAEKKYGMEEW